MEKQEVEKKSFEIRNKHNLMEIEYHNMKS